MSVPSNDFSGPRVYLIQSPRPKPDGWTPNLAPAAAYGTIFPIFGCEDRPFAMTQECLQKAQEKLRDFRPDIDYLLWPSMGDPAGMWIVVQYLTSIGINTLRYLYWNRARGHNSKTTEGHYMPVEIAV